MRSSVTDVLPPQVRRSLLKLTVQLMAERLAVAKSTYLRCDGGDPTLTMGNYAMAWFVLGFGTALGDLVGCQE